jgi:ankyrin repeat protein
MILIAALGLDNVMRCMADRYEPDWPNIDGYTPLYWAARKGHEAVVKMLLDTKKVDVNTYAGFRGTTTTLERG